MQSFLKVKKNIPGRDEKRTPVKSAKEIQSSSAGAKSVSEAHSTINNKGIKVEIKNAILANPARAGSQTDSLDTAITQSRQISPSLSESRLERRETTNVNAEVATVPINSPRKVIENIVGTKVSSKALTKVSINSGLSRNIPSELENDGDSDKENQPEIGSKKRKDSVSIPLLVTAGQKKFKTAVLKSPSFAQFGATVTSLPLPDSYNNLIHLFNQFDNTLVYLKQKNQNCIFHNIRRIVEVNANRTFAIEDFRKILTVEPDLYILRPYHIVNQDIDTFIIDFRETENIFDLFKLIPSRRLEFEKKLLKRAKQYHQDFLQQNSLQWEFDKLKFHWHPNFDVNIIPDIEMAPLPFGKKIGYLEKWKELNSIKSTPASGESYVVSSLKPSKSTAVDDKTAENGASEMGAPKKLSRAAALLEKIRAKEATKKREDLLMPSKDQQKYQSILSRLNEIASALLSYLKSNSKTVVRVPLAIKQLQQSHSDYFLSEDEWFEHIKVLTKVAPKFCTLETVVGIKEAKDKSDYLLRFHSGSRLLEVRKAVETATTKS